ncbi:MAG: autotransporter-associated beta strand repeat-containing protein [Akkermansiaceae bacterium]|nr:autotransporter-associated beta strand repeat-containing protein [Akkermansiaceae bacterium]
MKFKLAISALVVAGTTGVSEAQLVDGQTIGVDFGNTNPTTNDFIEYILTAGVVAVTKDVTGAPVSGGVTVTTAGFNGQNGDAVVNGGEPAVFDASNLEDWMGFPADATITIGGLDDSLEYELTIGAGFVNTDGRTTYTADGQSVMPDPVAANPFGTLSNLGTDGAGNLVISLTRNVSAVVTVSALTLRASTPLFSANTWQTDGGGNWSAALNWDPGVPNGAQNMALFDGALLTGPLTAALDVPVTIGDLAFDSTHAITIGGPSALTFDNLGKADLSTSAGSHQIAADVILGGGLDVSLAGGSAIEVSGALTGASTVKLVGGGDLVLSGDLSGFTGGLIAEGGVLEVASGSTATDVAMMNTKTGGEISIFGAVTVASNQSFGVGAGVTGTTGSVTVNPGGELNIGGGGGFTGIGGRDITGGGVGNGTLTVAGGTLNVAAPGTASASGLDASNFWMNPYGSGGGASTVNLDGGLLSTARVFANGAGGSTTIFNFNGGTLQKAAASAGALFGGLTRVNVRDGGGTIDTNGFDITYNAILSHSDIDGDAALDGGLTKTGSGTLTLGGVNTYTGLTTVSSGVLALSAAGSLVGDVTVGDGAGIGGVGTIGGLLTLGSSGGASVTIDPLSFTGIQTTDLTLNGVSELSISGIPSLGTTTYAIATYSGTLIDGNLGDLADSFTAPGYRLGAVNLNGQTLEAEITTESGTWTGTTSGNWETAGPDANWNNTRDSFFYNGDDALFNDSGANKTVTLLENVTPGYTEVTNTAGNNYTFTGAFGIAGATQLVKDGSGTLFIETDNTFSGGTTIYNGTVQVGTGGTSGNFGTGAVINDGIVILNRSDNLTLTNPISGVGSVVKNGPNTVTVGVAQPYSGSTTVAAGALDLVLNDTYGNHAGSDLDLTIEAGARVTNGTTAGFTTMEFLTLNGGELRATNNLSAAGGGFQAYGIRETVTVRGSIPSSITDIGQANGAINMGGAVDLGGGVGSSLIFDVADVTSDAATDLTVSAKLKNQGGIAFSGLTKTGAGTMALTRINTYTGVTSVEAGTLTLGDSTNNTGLADAADVSVASGAMLNLNYSGTDTIDGLVLAGVAMPTGTWGATGSGATHIDDTCFTGSGTLTVSTVTGTYGIWASANGLTGANANPNADIENGGTGDGLNNLLEFAFGTDPNAPDNTALTVTDPATFTPGNVRIEVSFSPLDIKLQYVRHKDFAAAGLTYTPEFSDSGGGFIPDPANPDPVVVSTQDPGDYEVVEVPFLLFDSGGLKADSVLGRVAVTLSP